MSMERAVKHLWECANAISADTHTKKLLKSHYLHTCRKIIKRKLQLPENHFSVSKMCPRCCSLWSENEFELALKPQQSTLKTKERRLVAQLEESKLTKKKVLTKKQRRRAKWLKKRATSNIQVHCKLCGHKTLVPLEKPNKKVKKECTSLEMTNETELHAIKAKKRKNKKKSKNAGLKIMPEQEKSSKVATESINRTVISKSNTERPLTSTKLKPPPLPALATAPHKVQTTTIEVKNILKNKTPAKSKAALKSNTTLSQTLKAKKVQKPKKKLNNKTAATLPLKIQSNTQQKNSLLQLAALLKKQTTTSAKSTTQNRLESFLK